MDSRSIGADLALRLADERDRGDGRGGGGERHLPPGDRRRRRPRRRPARELVEEYRSELMHPYYAAERGLVDDVIDPATPAAH